MEFKCAGCGKSNVKGIYCSDCLQSKGKPVKRIIKLRQLDLFGGGKR